MADRPIIFSAPMVRALLYGRKTQTRRVLKPPYGTLEYRRDGTWRPICTKFFPGDRLWVREAWTLGKDAGDIGRWHPDDRVFYRASDDDETTFPPRWRSPIHMPRWASRLTLTATDVRVHRLQEISEEDAQAEGISSEWDNFELYGQSEPYRYGFSALWNSIHGPGAWDANPWVAAITFTVRKGNIDHD